MLGGGAISQFSKAAELDPNNPWVRSFLGRAYLFNGMPQRGIEEMETAERLNSDDSYVLGFLGYAYAVTDRRPAASKVLQHLDELEQRRFVSCIARVYVYAGLGDKDKAFEWLEKAYEDHSTWLTYIKADPRFDSIRDDPRYRDLLRRMRLPE